jgi:hypothetical protein
VAGLLADIMALDKIIILVYNIRTMRNKLGLMGNRWQVTAIKAVIADDRGARYAQTCGKSRQVVDNLNVAEDLAEFARKKDTKNAKTKPLTN